MLPLKWKIFRVINYLYIAVTALITIAFIVGRTRGFFYITAFEIFFSVLVLICMLSLIVNSSLNIFLLDRFYPSQVPGQRIKGLYITCLVLNIIFYALLFLIFCYGFYEEFIESKAYDSGNYYGVLALVALALMIGTGMYIIINQVRLRNAIRRNYNEEMDRFLEEPTPL
jgi:hypothetical protein